MSAARYAIYFAPAAASPWWRFGAGWIGRDELRDAPLPQPRLVGFAPDELGALTTEPRRYGFHATLKAPFRLREQADEAMLLRRLQALASALHSVPLGPLQPVLLEGFVALVPRTPQPAVDALAARCVLELDDLRAPLTPEELARRRPERLDGTERELLARYGYPHVLDRVRFHLTLSNTLDGASARRLLAAAGDEVQRLNRDTPLRLDRLCLFRERQPGAPFLRVHDEVLA